MSSQDQKRESDQTPVSGGLPIQTIYVLVNDKNEFFSGISNDGKTEFWANLISNAKLYINREQALFPSITLKAKIYSVRLEPKPI